MVVKKDPDSLTESCNQLITTCQSLILATGDPDSGHASYAPVIFYHHNFYILVSGLAAHTRHLLDTQRKVGCMLIEDESAAGQIFARKRLMFKAYPAAVERESKHYSDIMSVFEKRFGEIIQLLQSLPDFVLIELKPLQATLVKGFGDAHQLTQDTWQQL